ncbi:hypothetical protein [Atopobacter phocae]|uniref:hypothetical protein n=1 Tax=Atopobacter phocae TaxID=136492 RepID=UPI00046E7B60|nr:hypothetical protein [Atopobacter phocae]
MLKEVIILKEKFTTNQIQILSMSPVSVEVFDDNEPVESFETNAKQTVYSFETPLDSIKEVVIKPIPGVQYSFLPAIKAL